MLDDLRKIIESEMEYDDINDLLMEATDNAIADMFIEDDGEAVMNDEEVLSILNKIPEYDEEAAMNKKLERLAEAYIPEELSYVEEGFISRRMLKKYSKEDLEEKIAKLEEEISELEGKEDRDKKDEKRLAKAKKEIADIKDFMEKNFVEVQESCEYDDEEDLDFLYEALEPEYVEEGFKELIKKLKRTLTENGRAANAHGNHLKNIRKGLINELNTTSSLDELKDFKKWVEDCANDPNLKEIEDKDLKDVIDEHIKWLNKFLNKIDKKINKAQKNEENVQESYNLDGEDLDLDFLYEALDLEYLKEKK